MLDKLRRGYNRTEYIRYLIMSEHNRRTTGKRPHEGQYCSDMRSGRPIKNRNTETNNKKEKDNATINSNPAND